MSIKYMSIFLRNLKRTNIYKLFIEYFFYPIFHFIWSFVINFNAKILHVLWNLKKRDYFDLDNNDKLLVLDNESFKKISNKILKESEHLIADAKNILFDPRHAEELKKGNIARAELPYSIGLYENLSPDLKKEIVDLASSDKMVTTASRYMKIFPILTRVEVYLNIPREGGGLRAAMLWHKDGFGFKNLDFFMAVTDVDEDNGPFYCLEKKIKAGIFKSFENLITRTGERNKVNLENFDKQFKDTNKTELKGKSGSGIFLDSFSTFHRGGYCKSKDRISLRFCYQSQDVFCENFLRNDNYFAYDKSIKKNETENIFKEFLFFKKPSRFMKFLTDKLIKFYYLIEYKYKI